MSKKYTIRDIAKQAGVSVATVSYVINHREDQRISEETKKKVWQIVNLLDYRPNSSAKSLATNKTYNIALILRREDSLYKRSEQLAVAHTLASVLQSHGYHLLLQSEENIERIDYADAIFCYDTDNDFFNRVGDNNLIPLIAIDSLTPLQIFFQICTDYARLKAMADEHFCGEKYSYLCLAPNNAELSERILNVFPSVIFVPTDASGVKSAPAENVNLKSMPAVDHKVKSAPGNDAASEAALLVGSDTKPTAVTGNILYSQQSLASLAGPMGFCPGDRLREKMEQVFACFELAFNRVPDCEHNIFV